MKLVSVTSGGAPADGASRTTGESSITADGGRVLFITGASNLGGLPGVYVRDPAGNANHFLGRSGGGLFDADAVLSADGTLAVFNSESCGSLCFVRLGPGGAPESAPQAILDEMGNKFYISSPGISGDGQRVVFHAPPGFMVTNGDITGDAVGDILYTVPGSNEYSYAYAFFDADGDPGVRDCNINLAPEVSNDGRYIAFIGPSQLEQFRVCGPEAVYVKDLQTGSLTKESVVGTDASINQQPYSFDLSGDGSKLAFATDYFGRLQVFVRDLPSKTSTLASVDGSGEPLAGTSRIPSLNFNGSLVAFYNSSPGEAYLRDLDAQTTTRLTQTGGEVSAPELSADGTKLAFTSGVGLVRADTNQVADVYLMDLSLDLVVNSDADRADRNPDNGRCDTGGSVSGGPECTLRAAIQEANAKPDRTKIVFDIRGDTTIEPQEDLPEIRAPVVIDGTTQPLFERHPLIRIEGPARGICRDARGPRDGLRVSANNSVIRGLTIGGFPCTGIEVGSLSKTNRGIVVEGNYIGTDEGDQCSHGDPTPVCPLSNGAGITVHGTQNLIGGSSEAARNVISNNMVGVEVLGVENRVSGNYIGTDVDGDDIHSNPFGVALYGTRNVLGGPRLTDVCSAPCNVIAGATYHGVGINSAGDANKVIGNFIGLSADGGHALSNNRGIDLDGAHRGHVIGGSGPGEGNVISGNGRAGIYATGGTKVRIEGNIIGAGPGPGGAIPNDNGIEFDGVVDGTIGGAASPTSQTCTGACNYIAHNRHAGITVSGVDLTKALIFGNVVTENGSASAAFADRTGAISVIGGAYATIGNGGPGNGNVITDNFGNGVFVSNSAAQISGNSIHSNGLLGIEFLSRTSTIGDVPVLFESLETNGTAQVKGFLNGRAGKPYLIEVFANEVCDPSGNGEGQVPVASAAVTTDARGRAAFEVTGSFVPTASTSFTATSTETFGGAVPGRTSEFSRCMPGTPVAELTSPAAAGSTILETDQTNGIEPGDRIEINPGGETSESATVASKGSLIVEEPLRFDHAAGEIVVKTSDPADPPQETQLFVSARLKRSIVVTGRMDPAYPGAPITLELQRRSEGKWRRAARKTAVLGEPLVLGDGSVVGRFRSRFKPLRSGTCRVRARWRGDVSYAASTATSKTFSCRGGS